MYKKHSYFWKHIDNVIIATMYVITVAVMIGTVIIFITLDSIEKGKRIKLFIKPM